MINGQGTVQIIERNINSNDASQQTSTTTVNSTLFTFTRTSAQGASPLSSTFTTDSASNGLNGTMVECLEVDGPMAEESTLILIMDINHCELLIL